MKSDRKNLHKNSVRLQSSPMRVLRLVSDDLSRYFPYALTFVALALGVTQFRPAIGKYFSWPAVFGLLGLLAFFAMTSAVFRVADRLSENGEAPKPFRVIGPALREFISRTRAAFGVRTAVVRQWGRAEYVKFALSAGLVAWAISADAFFTDIVILLFGCAAVLSTHLIKEKTTYVIAAASIAVLPLAQAQLEHRFYSMLCAAAFELFFVAVATSFVRVVSREREVVHTLE
jgi:hypothetical protein